MQGYRSTTCGVAIFLGLTCLGVGCRPVEKEPHRAGSPILVSVSILPQAYFVERIGGSRVDVQVLVGSGQSPHTYEPTPKQLARLAQSRLFFRIGLPFEDRLLKKMAGAFETVEIVDTQRGIPLRTMEAEEVHEDTPAADDVHGEHESHAEHDAHAHEAGEPDPHTWLDPALAKMQAATMCEALCRIDPTHDDEYQANLKRFNEDMDALRARLAASLAPLKGREFFVFHPAFGYFGDAFGLKQTPVEVGGKEPGPRQLAELIERARTESVRLIFVQQQFPTSSAEAVAKAIGGVVVPLDPLAYDYMANLENMAAQVATALQGSRDAAGGRASQPAQPDGSPSR